jgi:hypothetical protein
MKYTAAPVNENAVYNGPWTNDIDGTGANGLFRNDQFIPYKYVATLHRVETQLTPTRFRVTQEWNDEKLSAAPSRIEYVPLQFVDTSIGNETPIAVVRHVLDAFPCEVLVWGPQDVHQPKDVVPQLFWRNKLFDYYRPLEVPICGCGVYYLKQAHANRRDDVSK